MSVTEQSTKEETGVPTLPEVEKQLTPKEIAENNRSIQLWYKNQIYNIKPQVDLAELRARLQKATYESYVYAAKVDEFEAQYERAKELKEKAGDQAPELTDKDKEVPNAS